MCRIVRRVSREGAHTGAPAYADVKTMPLAASASMCGVEMFRLVFGPVKPTSPNPRSSERIKRKFGGGDDEDAGRQTASQRIAVARIFPE